MNLYLKIILGDWENASRDKRELRVAMELGYDIVVIASTKKNNKIFKDKVEEFDVIRIPTRSFGEGKIKKYLGYIWGYILLLVSSILCFVIFFYEKQRRKKGESQDEAE